LEEKVMPTAPVDSASSDPNIAAVMGTQTGNDGTAIVGIGMGNGVFGQSTGPNGFAGVRGQSNVGPGVSGASKGSVGVDATTDTGPAALRAVHTGHGPGVFGKCGGVGTDGGGAGVWGDSDSGPGVSGTSNGSVGVDAKTQSGPAALRAVHAGGGNAGYFEGNVVVTGDITLPTADCAEDFNIGAELLLEPGTVVVLGQEGALFPSLKAYDKRVAGVISGAGEYRPGIILDKQETRSERQPVSLLGKVFCKVDAEYGAIEAGDQLTTSPTPGHAMKAADQARAFGSVIGKALRSFSDGKGLIPILIALQ
jgi:hypothetical protein